MDSQSIGNFAGEMLGLNLDEREAAALVGPLAALRKVVAEFESVPLPFSADPFVTPRSSEDWLENWPEL